MTKNDTQVNRSQHKNGKQKYCYAKRPNIVHMKRIKQKPH